MMKILSSERTVVSRPPFRLPADSARGDPRDGEERQCRCAEGDEAGCGGTLVPDEGSDQAGEPGSPEVPASLVRLGRTARFRQAATAIAAALDLDTGDFSIQLVSALAALAHTMGKDLAEPDWWRILDALVLIAAHPAAP